MALTKEVTKMRPVFANGTYTIGYRLILKLDGEVVVDSMVTTGYSGSETAVDTGRILRDKGQEIIDKYLKEAELNDKAQYADMIAAVDAVLQL